MSDLPRHNLPLFVGAALQGGTDAVLHSDTTGIVVYFALGGVGLGLAWAALR